MYLSERCANLKRQQIELNIRNEAYGTTVNKVSIESEALFCCTYRIAMANVNEKMIHSSAQSFYSYVYCNSSRALATDSDLIV